MTLRVGPDTRPSVGGELTSTRVVSVLFESDVEAWRRGWAPETPFREAVVSVGDPIRGATTAGSTRTFPRRDLAYTVLGTPIDIDRLVDTVREYLDGTGETAPVVIIDDLAPLLEEFGPETVRRLVASLSATAADVSGETVVGCSITPNATRAIDTLIAAVDDIDGIDGDVVDAVNRLRRKDPTTFGYTRRYWPEARQGIDACDRNYPQSKQIHAALADPETTPQALGATLSGLVELGVLETWGDTVGSTRYDLTAYDPIRGAHVMFALVESATGVSSPDIDG